MYALYTQGSILCVFVTEECGGPRAEVKLLLFSHET